jgi:hypothetical protein
MKSFRFDTGGKPLTDIAHPDICRGAAFRLDRPMTCSVDDLFEMDKGQWFKIVFVDGERRRIPIDGRWVVPKVSLIPEKKQGTKTVRVAVGDEE